VEYVVKDFPGISIELDPGVYFQDEVSGDAFDIPGKAYVTFPLKKDKIFAVVALGWGIYQDPPVAPGGGIIWLITDKLRLQGVFPKPALIYQPNDDWDLRILGELNYTSFRTDDVLTTERKLQLHNAVVQYSEDRAGVQVGYSGFKPFKIIAGAGVTVERNFDFFRARTSGSPRKRNFRGTFPQAFSPLPDHREFLTARSGKPTCRPSDGWKQQPNPCPSPRTSHLDCRSFLFPSCTFHHLRRSTIARLVGRSSPIDNEREPPSL
jgi:hypothetical protein